MSDAELLAALTSVRDKLVIAIADVERGDHLRASEVLAEAREVLLEAVKDLGA